MKTYVADRMQVINGIFRKNNNWNGYIFRGQELKEWGLVPSLFRHKPNSRLDYSDLIDHHFDRFIIASRGHKEVTELKDDDSRPFDLWAIGQHNELLTPLLDWTASPYIALFFAFCEKRKIIISKPPSNLSEINKKLDQPRTVFCLNAKIINRKYYEAISKTFKRIDIKTYRSYLEIKFDNTVPPTDLQIGKMLFDDNGINVDPTKAYDDLESLWNDILDDVHEKWIRIFVSRSGGNKRMIAQRGVFTFLADPTDLIDFIYNNYGDSEEVLSRIDIGNTSRDQILTELSNMNITHMSLFPDIQGAGLYANYKYLLNSKLNALDTHSWI
jgi:hypothetical protein